MSESEKPNAEAVAEVKAKPRKRSWRWRFLRFLVLSFAGLVTLLFLFHAEENWRGKRAWENYRKEQEAKGVSFDFNSVVPPSIPDERNFAMTPLLKPLYEFNPPGVQPRFKDTNALERIPDFFPQPWDHTAIDLPSLGAWRYGVGSTLKQWQKAIFASTNLQHHAEMGEPADDVLYALKQLDIQLDELHQASKNRPLTRYPIRYNDDVKVAILLPHLAKLKNITKTLALRASAYLEKGETDKAFADVNLILFLAEPIEKEPFMVSHLVRIACFEYGLRVVWLGTVNHQWKQTQLENWQKRFWTYDIVKDAYRALQGERMLGNSSIEIVRRYPHIIGNVMEEFSDWARPREGIGISDTQDMLWQLIPSGWFYMEQVAYNQAFDRYFLVPAAKDKAGVDVDKVMKADQDLSAFMGSRNPIKHVIEHSITVKNFMPAMMMFFQRGVRAQSTVDLALVAIALERYHLLNQDYPETLDALIPDYAPSLPLDILSHLPFKYERQSKDAFRLWSVGWNLKDDGGVIVRQNKRPDAGIKIEEGDWTWPQPEKKSKPTPGSFE